MSELGAASWKRRGQILREKPQPEEPKRSNHKDTKKWCKGVKGREHEYKWVEDIRHPWDWYIDECQKCKKQRDYCVIWNWQTYNDLEDRCKCGHHRKVK